MYSESSPSMQHSLHTNAVRTFQVVEARQTKFYNRLTGTVESAYLQVIFVRENIAIKRSVRLPESTIQTGRLTELEMQMILSFC